MFEKIFKKRDTRGITLIALVITIIVLLILAGVVVNSIMSQDSAPEKAAQSRIENDKGAARDAATIKAVEYVQEYYDQKHVQGSEGLLNMTEGKYVAQAIHNQIEGDYIFIVEGTILKVFSVDADVSKDKPIVGGMINDDGTITWMDEEQMTSNLTAEERTALAANGMAELTESQITNNNLINNENIKAVLTGQVPVPVGYTYVEGTSTTKNTTPTSWGVVVEDENHNEWVWVPVADASEMYDEIEPTQIGKIKQEESDTEIAEEKHGIKLASIYGIESLFKVADSSSESESEEARSVIITIKYYKDGKYNTVDYITKLQGEQLAESDIDINKYEGYKARIEQSLPVTVKNDMTINVYCTCEAKEITTNKKSKSEIISGITRGTPGSKDWSEPALVPSDDLNSTHYTQAGFSTAKEMADAFVKDYNDMIASVEKYGGYYIGRYELSGSVENPTLKSGGTVLTATNWYQHYKACRNIKANNTSVVSTMIFGCQWDMMCKWTQESGDMKSYSTHNPDKRTGWFVKSGVDSNDKINNIYDTEGNYREKTQEARCGYYSNSDFRTVRGGICYAGYDSPISYRHIDSPDDSNSREETSRPSLYIK